MHTIYLDHAAATPIRDEVLKAMLPYLSEHYGNPSSIHHKGRAAIDALEHTRASIAHALSVKPSEIMFTSGGTESNNLALLGIAHANHTKGKHVLVSTIEHVSVLETCTILQKEGFEIEYIPVTTEGVIEIEEVLSRVRTDTIMISVMLANNEIGTIEPIRAIVDAVHRKFDGSKSRPYIHTDACQATGQLNVSPHELGVDLMTINSAKIYGPKGVGLLYIKEGTSLTPMIYGGTQENGRRAGTENVAAIVGFGEALRLAVLEQVETHKNITELRDYFHTMIQDQIPEIKLNGHKTLRLPNNLNYTIPYIEGESLVLLLDSFGICASTGSACGAHNLLPSHVLRAIQIPTTCIHGSIRFTLGKDTTKEELESTVVTLKQCINRLQNLSPLPLSI